MFGVTMESVYAAEAADGLVTDGSFLWLAKADAGISLPAQVSRFRDH